jgi:hypothetical protein
MSGPSTITTATPHDATHFEGQLTGLLEAVQASPALVGYCYTQLTDTGQETNGLLRADRTPKIPIESIRSIIVGRNAQVQPPLM